MPYQPDFDVKMAIFHSPYFPVGGGGPLGPGPLGPYCDYGYCGGGEVGWGVRGSPGSLGDPMSTMDPPP